MHRRLPFDVFMAIWARGPGETAVAAARICRRPAVVHVMGGEFVWLPDVPFGAHRRWRRELSKLVVRYADQVTAASQPMLDLVREASGVQATRITLGVDTGQWVPEPPRRRQPGRTARLVSVGSLTPVKGHATLLRAVAELVRAGRDVRVDLVGEDTSGGAVPALARDFALDRRVTLHGFLPQPRAHAVVRDADLMIVTSRHEAGPVAMLEAAAVGVPTVGTPVGHVVEWAPDAAALVPQSDAPALAGAIAALLDDEERRLEMARRAQARAVAEDADWTAARFEELLERVTREGGR
jgi:glycosyltransferase involved in cell wall biosynthesis